MRSSSVNPGDAATAAQYDNLRHDAYGGSMLLAHQQTTPDLTLYVEPGVFYIGTTRVIFTGGNSPSFTAPSANPRIDILTMDSSGTLAITQGTEGASPLAPSYPTNKLVICEVYNVVSETALYDNDAQVSGQGYISNDVRPINSPVYISDVSQVKSGLFFEDPGSPAQGDVFYTGSGSVTKRLPAGTDGQFLKTGGSGADPSWSSVLITKLNGTVSPAAVTVTTTAQSQDTTVTHNLGRTPAFLMFSFGVAVPNNPSTADISAQVFSVLDASGNGIGGMSLTYEPSNGVYSPGNFGYSVPGNIISISTPGATWGVSIGISITNITTTQFTVHITYQITTGSTTTSWTPPNITWAVIG